MKNLLSARIGCAIGTFLLIGTLALAQTKPTPKTAPQAKAAGHPPAETQNPSAHANSLAVDHAGGNGVRRMDGGKSGVNPLFESKDKSVAKPTAPASATPPSKATEDMTTRYRPGNNKTTTINPAKPQSGKTPPPQ